MSTSSISPDLLKKIRYSKIEELRLPVRAYNSLKRADIHLLSQVIDLGEDGVYQIRNLGQRQVDNIFNSVAEFLRVPRASLATLTTEYGIKGISETIVIDSEEDHKVPSSPHDLYLDEPGKSIPEKEFSSDLSNSSQVDISLHVLKDTRPFIIEIDPNTLPNLIELIVPFSKKLLEVFKYERGFEVIKRHFGLEGSKVYTLQEIGYYYDLTRERVRQIEFRAMSRIKEAVLGISIHRHWQVPQKLVDEAKTLLVVLQSGDAILTKEELIQIVKNRYQYNVTAQKLNDLRFLLNIFEFQPLPKRLAGNTRDFAPSWVVNQNVKIQPLLQIAKSIYDIIQASAAPISIFDLKIQLNRKHKRIENSHFNLAVKAISNEIEIVNDDNYQIKFECLSSLGNQAYRVLFETKEPMYLRDIQRQINHRLVKAGNSADAQIRNLSNQLVTDARFEAIGRSGIWSLSEWEGIHRKTAIELMQEFFHVKQSSATVVEVYDYVFAKRSDVSKQSINAYLSSHEVFVKVDRNLYELSSWGRKPYQSIERRSPEEAKKLFISAIKEIFKDIPDKAMLLSELSREIVTRTGIPQPAVYQKLRQSSMIQLKDDLTSKKKKVAHYIGDAQERSDSAVSSKSTLRELVQQEVKRYLQRQPNRKSSVTELSGHIEKMTGCKRTTFYTYLSEMEAAEAIRKVYEEGRLYCHLGSLEVPEPPITLLFPQVEEVKDEVLKANLIRAIKNLDVDNVDLALFQLGKIFEVELKAFLLEAKDRGKFTITAKDLGRLASMIDCVESNGIIKQKHHLTLLREHRNERAHGEIPNLKERQRLMQHAPFLGDLYIKYILFFNEQRKSL